MLELVLDITWDKIEEIEAEKARRAAERKIPMYSNPSELEVRLFLLLFLGCVVRVINANLCRSAMTSDVFVPHLIATVVGCLLALVTTSW